MSILQDPAVPVGSIILVTGVTGYIGSHIADQFLHYGYNVRGAVRDLLRASWLSEVFDAKYGKGRFEPVLVPDMEAEKAFDTAVQGAAAFVHTASDMSRSTDAQKVIPGVIASSINAIKSAYSAPTMKRFIFTSSNAAVYTPYSSGPVITIGQDTWNEAAIEAAWNGRSTDISQVFNVYAASKARAEQEVLKYFTENREKRPDLIAATVVVNFNFGERLSPKHQRLNFSCELPMQLLAGEIRPELRYTLGHFYSDVTDTARLHVAAAISKDTKGERIFGYAGKFHWDDVLDVLRKNFPDRIFPGNFSGDTVPVEVENPNRAGIFLRGLGRPGFIMLEETILRTVKDGSLE